MRKRLAKSPQSDISTTSASLALRHDHRDSAPQPPAPPPSLLTQQARCNVGHAPRARLCTELPALSVSTAAGSSGLLIVACTALELPPQYITRRTAAAPWFKMEVGEMEDERRAPPADRPHLQRTYGLKHVGLSRAARAGRRRWRARREEARRPAKVPQRGRRGCHCRGFGGYQTSRQAGALSFGQARPGTVPRHVNVATSKAGCAPRSARRCGTALGEHRLRLPSPIAPPLAGLRAPQRNQQILIPYVTLCPFLFLHGCDIYASQGGSEASAAPERAQCILRLRTSTIP